MAERRMFSCKITSSDSFKLMSLGAQALYFQLGMEADDDGFVNNPLSVARSLGASQAEIEELIDNRFLIRLTKSLVVIKHWGINNYIKKDRYKETAYKQYKDLLVIKENGSYTEKDKSDPCWTQFGYTLDTDCLQFGSKMDTQDRIGKDRIDYTGSSPLQEESNKNNLNNNHTGTTPSVCPELLLESPPAPPKNVISLLLVDKSEYEVSENELKEYQETFPDVDVMQQLREMKLWCEDPKNRRKTRKGIRTFIRNWLSREQDKGYRPAQKGQNNFYGGAYIKGSDTKMAPSASGKDRERYQTGKSLEEIL